MSQEHLEFMKNYQKEYFVILSEFFIGATGTTPTKFAKPNDFSTAIRAMGGALHKSKTRQDESYNAYVTMEKKSRKLYGTKSIDTFKASGKEIAEKITVQKITG